MGMPRLMLKHLKSSLNPYSNGITSLGKVDGYEHLARFFVLILILMELPHWEERAMWEVFRDFQVLILILMELPHWGD